MSRTEIPPIELNARYAAKQYLLSHAEFRFFRVLHEAVDGQTLIAVKVRLADLVCCVDKSPDRATLGRITQKHLDFVLFDKRHTRILAAVELDDSSHERAMTIQRDRFVNDLLNSIGIPLLRVQAAGKYNPMVLRQQIAITLRPMQPEQPAKSRGSRSNHSQRPQRSIGHRRQNWR